MKKIGKAQDVSTVDLLSALYGDCGTGELILVGGRANVVAGHFALSELDKASRWIDAYDSDLWFKVNLFDHSRFGPSSIGGKAELAVSTVVGFDLDCNSKDARYASREQLLEAIGAMPLQPFALINSNGPSAGLHVHYKYRPVIVDSLETRNRIALIHRQWWTLFAAKLREVCGNDVRLDAGHQPERLLRAVGSKRKTGNMVTVLRMNPEAIYTLDQIAEHCPPIELAEEFSGVARDKSSKAISKFLSSKYEDEGEALAAVLAELTVGGSRLKPGDAQGEWIKQESTSGQPTLVEWPTTAGLGATFKSSEVTPFRQGEWYSTDGLWATLTTGKDSHNQPEVYRAAARKAQCHLDFDGIDWQDVTAELSDTAKPQDSERYPMPITADVFNARKYDLRFIVDRVVAADVSCVIAGASKSLKTTLSLHMAISIASGTKFLGEFDCTPSRVLFASAESGEPTLQRNMRGWADLTGVSIDDLGRAGMLSFMFWVPRSNDKAMMAKMRRAIRQCGAEVLFLDPLYRCLDGEGQSNLSLNGEQIMRIVELAHSEGAQVIIDDHVKRSSENAKTFTALELEDISGSGKAELFRQWVLLGRRSLFVPGQPHELWVNVGGSVGQCGQWGLDVRETISPDYRDITYQLELMPHNGVDLASRARRQEEAEQADRLVMLDRLLAMPKTFTQQNLRDEYTLNGTVAKSIIDFGLSIEIITKEAIGKRDIYHQIDLL